MNQEENFSKEESLKLINEMILKAKNSHYETGLGPLMWGSVITFCSLFNFFEVQFNFTVGFDIWMLTFIAVLPQIIITIRGRKNKKFKGYDDAAMNYVWVAFAISIFLLINFLANVHNNPGQGIPLYLILYGIPTFITAGIKNFKPMKLGAAVCWISAIITVYTNLKAGLLLMALSAVFAWLIPGIILRKKYLKLLEKKQ